MCGMPRCCMWYPQNYLQLTSVLCFVLCFSIFEGTVVASQATALLGSVGGISGLEAETYSQRTKVRK